MVLSAKVLPLIMFDCLFLLHRSMRELGCSALDAGQNQKSLLVIDNVFIRGCDWGKNLALTRYTNVDT